MEAFRSQKLKKRTYLADSSFPGAAAWHPARNRRLLNKLKAKNLMSKLKGRLAERSPGHSNTEHWAAAFTQHCGKLGRGAANKLRTLSGSAWADNSEAEGQSGAGTKRAPCHRPQPLHAAAPMHLSLKNEPASCIWGRWLHPWWEICCSVSTLPLPLENHTVDRCALVRALPSRWLVVHFCFAETPPSAPILLLFQGCECRGSLGPWSRLGVDSWTDATLLDCDLLAMLRRRPRRPRGSFVMQALHCTTSLPPPLLAHCDTHARSGPRGTGYPKHPPPDSSMPTLRSQ